MATKLLCNELHASTVELNSDDIDCVMDILKQQFGHLYAGLEPSVLGQCTLNKSIPLFSAAGDRPFVQILNVGDPWVCCTNSFAECREDVFVYDSLLATIGHSLAVQISSIGLLRGGEDKIFQAK